MGFSLAGYKLINWLNTMASGSPVWTAEDFWNLSSEDRGKINLHHDTFNWDFYVTRSFTSNDDEVIYVQPLSTIYSNYGLTGTTDTSLQSGEITACTFISRPWLEDNVVQGRGDASIYAVAGRTSITWCAQVGTSNEGGFGISALGSFGFVNDYRFAGGLPYDATNQRPQYLKDHFFTSGGSVQAILSYPGVTSIFTAQSYEDMIDANPFVEDSTITFRLMQIYLKDADTFTGPLPDLFWLSGYRVTLEPSDGLTVYGSVEDQGIAFQDGYAAERWVVMHKAVEI